MDSCDLEVPHPYPHPAESPIKEWRIKYQTGTISKNDFIQFFQKESRKYYEFSYDYEEDASRPSLKCFFREQPAKEGIIDIVLEFILGDNPELVLEKLRLEGNTAAVCGKVFKTGEPTYSCRECGMDPTCVLCVNCFKKSAHRYHKYKMSTSGGGGCCDCGDEEAWKRDHYCEEHLLGKQNQQNSAIITDSVKERCELVFTAILTFCMSFLEIETNASLKCLDGEDEGVDDYYCTVLYNDESHTFDQVISTLEKIAKCRRKDANGIVSSIDREGRAVVKCDTFGNCKQLKESIEKQPVTTNVMVTRINQSLRVSVLNIRAVACQQFALQLLSWMQDFLVRHCTFRQIFARLIMDRKAPYCIRNILEHDVKLWKTARTCWHRLLISGMLMEYDNKMALAQEFSRQYSTIMQEFIRDDHEHSFSIVSMSVQLFTVPSISHYLIANEGIFYKLLHIFFHESVENYIQNKTLHFTKTLPNSSAFKRSSYILYDLRYILSFRPDAWTDQLREGFLDGCKALLKLLNVMQGMEAVKRQVGQHMDYEPEWESAFNLHIKLAITITLTINWSASDGEVLRKFYLMIMRYLVNNDFILKDIVREERSVAGHVAECLIYDVASQPVSIHLPLSRLYAGVYMHIGGHGMSYDNVGSNPKRSPEELMEPILCTQVMIAQVNAGMWRRNGYSLLHQLFFYRNVRFRLEMLDRDIAGLQIAASLIESNQFLIHALNKFGLLEWVSPGYEDTVGCKTGTDDDFVRLFSMIDEFLELMIVIIGERYMPGISNVTEADRTKKEIIQLLCIKSYSHSELHRALPESNNETALEDVIDTVAVFRKPQRADTKGVYELKEEYYEDYNMFFYHYTKEEKSKSEEVIRNRRKAKSELVCCPPPKLPKLAESFLPLANLLQCDVMMRIMTIVLERGLDEKSKSFSDNHLQKVLHLIGYGLQEEKSGHYPFLTFYERAQRHQIPSKLEELTHMQRVEAHRDFILWILKEFKALQPVKEDAAKGSGEGMADEDADSSKAALEKEKAHRARLAAESRAKIMAQIQNAQKSFMKSNADLLGATSTTAAAAPGAPSAMDWQEAFTEGVGDAVEEEEEEGAVAYKTQSCLGVDRRLQNLEDQHFKCILCFEDCSVTKEGHTMVYSVFVQRSKVLPPDYWQDFSIYASTCGHGMHATCWQEYYNNEENKEPRRPRIRPQHSPGQNAEFMCPYCRCLSNAVLPLTAPLSKYSMPNVVHAGDKIFPFDQWLEVMRIFNQDLTALEEDDLISTLSWESVLKKSYLTMDVKQFERIAQPVDTAKLNDNWIKYVQHYIKTTRYFADSVFDLNECEGLQYMFQSCIYTIQSLELYLRATSKPLKDEMNIRHESCLSGLIRACSLYAGHLPLHEAKELILPVTKLLDGVLEQKSRPVLMWNCFKMMVETIFMVPSLLFATDKFKTIVCSGSIMDFYTLQLFFLANLVKAIILYEAPNDEETDTGMDVDDEDLERDVKTIPEEIQNNIVKFYHKYNLAYRRMMMEKLAKQRQQQEQQEQQHSPSDECDMSDLEWLSAEIADITDAKSRLKLIARLFEHLQMEMREFLRCSCLFFHFVTDVKFPDEFAYDGNDTFENMCRYLGLTTRLEKYFDNKSSFMTMMETFASHPDIESDYLRSKKTETAKTNAIVPCIHSIPQLVTLPEDYSDLINSVSDFICPNNEREEMKSPTMCLVCGEILCAQSYCCQLELQVQGTVGACTHHNHFCGADIGLFLRIRDCQVVFLGRNKGVLVQAPYLDEYGETDQGLKRGNPLHLCPLRYKKLHLIWLGHLLHDEISRLNDGASPLNMQWHSM